jgi:hypothetical protein
VLLALATETAAQAIPPPPNLPIAIICYAPANKTWHVGYLDLVHANGDALYLSANGKIGSTVNAQGVVVAPANRPAALDCFGKTVDDLRGIGRVMDFPPAR